METRVKEYWTMTEQTFYCLIDKQRTNAFKNAIKNTVKLGDVAVDMGSGTGILAFFAADAGAKRVYAIENDSYHYESLQKNIKLNGYRDRIILINEDVRDTQLPEKVDVIIGEMIATGLIEELQIPAMNNILLYAKRNVKVVLNYYENYADLVFHNDVFYKHKLKILRYEFPDLPDQKSTPLSDKVMYARINCSKINKHNKIDKKLTIKIKKNGIVNGLRISSKTIFFDGSVLESTYSYSYPLIFPLDDMQVKKGESYQLNLSYQLCGGLDSFKYYISRM